ncbi:hypothetical protein D1007_33229 [Hordeum vulgare]|nr:hypothetical protein D1007_33229 [Hordeum vulgare]
MSHRSYLLAQKCRCQAILSNNVSFHPIPRKDVAQELLARYGKWDSSVHHDPNFSVRLTEVHSLDPARGPVIRPGFNLELHVHNKGIDKNCKEEITVTVFYGDMVVGMADVPDFCVDKRSTADVNLKLSHADVLLTDTLRRRLVSELRSEELEFDMEMRMVIPMGSDWECRADYCTSTQSFRWCRAKPGQGYAHCDFF